MAELVSTIVIKVFQKSLAAAFHDLMRRRTETARQILLSQLASGDANIQDIADIDEAVAMAFEYMSAAHRGAARVNLRLMAQVMQGQIQNSPPLYADNFLRWASLLASLSREEIIAVTAYRKMWIRHELERKGQDPNAGNDKREVDVLIGPGRVFKDGAEFHRTISALIRTGLVVAASGWGSLVYEPTDLLDELLKLVDVEAALREPVR